MAKSAAQQAAQKRYDAQNTRVYTFKLNNKTDADLISYLDGVPNKQGAIKTALREHIERIMENEKNNKNRLPAFHKPRGYQLQG